MPIDFDPDGAVEADRDREIPAAPNGHGRATPEAQDVPEGPAKPNGPDSQEGPGPLGSPDGRGDAQQAGECGTDDGPGSDAFRQQQIAAHLKYRERVAGADRAYEARQAWAEAVPGLRAAWAEHLQNHPERPGVRYETQPDGSWVTGDGRGLSPEQNAEASKACADLRDEADQVILPAMQRVADASPDGTLAGLEHMLKGEDRLKEKLADVLFGKPEKDIRDALGEIADAVRFTLAYESDRYAEGVSADVDRLKAEGFELVKFKNLWHADQYKGINSQWRSPETGTRIEMQFHTPESLEAKELTHDAYERIRGSDVSPAERRDLKAFQRRANALLVTPPGTTAIKDFPEKNSD